MNQTQHIARVALQNIEKGVALASVLQAIRDTLKKYKLENLYRGTLLQIKQGLEKSLRDKTLYVETPYELSAENIKKIESIVGDTDGRSVQKVDQSLLAGFRAVYKGKVYDASAKSHITNLKKAY